jgi:hypothetical protein
VTHLSDYELDQLLQSATAAQRPLMARLLEEVRELRDNQAEREFIHAQEVEY